jgi:hypothetical protein
MNPADTTPADSSSTAGSTVREELSQDASHLADTATERARQEAETRKQQTTQTARSASSALDRAAEELEQDENAPSWLSSAFRQTASGIERLARSLEGRSPDQLAGDVTRFARQNPGAFLAASAAAGFAAARFLKAGAEHKSHQSDAKGGSGSTFSDTSGSYGSGASYGSAADYGAGTSNTSSPYGGSSAGTGSGYGRSSDAGATSNGQTGTGYGSTAGYGSPSTNTEPAGYGSNPEQGGPA